MVRGCCVKTCTEQSMLDRSLSFFRFPSNEELKEKWLRAGPGYKTVSKFSYVCSKHFLPDDYTDWTAYGGIRKLKKNAVPSIFDLVRSTNVVDKNPDIDNNNSNECSSCHEANMEPEVTDVNPRSNTSEDETRSSVTRLQESQDDERITKKYCSTGVQTSLSMSRLNDRERKLRAEIHRLQSRLRRRDKKIGNVKDLIAHLKDAGKCSDNLEEEFLREFTNFDLELFKNLKENRNVSKNFRSYTQAMKDFASRLYFHSPRAYKFVRTKIYLPHVSTLRRWVKD